MECSRSQEIQDEQSRPFDLFHPDPPHNGAAPLSEHVPGMSVRCGGATAALLARGEDAVIGLDLARRAGVYPTTYRWRPPAAARSLVPDTPLAIGALQVTLLPTPGHSADHCSYLLRLGAHTALVSGDALFWGGRVFLQVVPDCSVAALLDSIRALSMLRFEMLLPEHAYSRCVTARAMLLRRAHLPIA